jgi:hypothetical protein
MFLKANRGWYVIGYIPLGGEFITQPLHLKETRYNEGIAKRIKRDLEDALRAGTLEGEFAKRFPNSKVLARLGLKPSTEPTLGEFALTWLSEKVKLSPASHYDYESLLRVHILPHPRADKRLSASTMATSICLSGTSAKGGRAPKRQSRNGASTDAVGSSGPWGDQPHVEARFDRMG